MDKAEFRSWLGSDLATRQLAAALDDARLDECSFCGAPPEEEGANTAGLEYGFEMPICPTCFKETIVND